MQWVFSAAIAYIWAVAHTMILGEDVPFHIFALFVLLVYALLERVEVETYDEEDEGEQP